MAQNTQAGMPQAVASDKRNKQPAVPESMAPFLNDEQLGTLNRMEGFGWHIKFVRRPLFQEPIIALESHGGDKLCILELDGSMNSDTASIVRH